jgi:hypothetical protein
MIKERSEARMTGNNEVIKIILIVGFCILAFTAICFYGTYHLRTMQYENFQKTLAGLSEEQKCLHICGFQYPDIAYLENYKFCVEKCDRISERTLKS